jgi:hypothetical protein
MGKQANIANVGKRGKNNSTRTNTTTGNIGTNSGNVARRKILNANIAEALRNNNANEYNSINVESKNNSANSANSANIGTAEDVTQVSFYDSIVSNYMIVVAIVIIIILILLVFFLSKSYRVGRTMDTMVLYQSYQTLRSFPYSKASFVRLGDCRIAASYNSVLSGYQMYDYTSEAVLLSVLRSGARYVEFNVFNSSYRDDAYPVVNNGYKEGEWRMCINDTSLEKCFYILVQNAFEVMNKETGVPNPEDPLFIGFNLSTNYHLLCLNRIAQLILQYFPDKLLESRYSYQNSDKLMDMTLGQLSNKVVLFSSDGFQGSNLEELINYSWDSGNKLRRVYYGDVLENESLDELREFNKSGMTIIVPHREGDIITVNYDSAPFLNAGCQFIAMNYQLIDAYMDPYITMFKNYSIMQKPTNLIKKRNISNRAALLSGAMGERSHPQSSGAMGERSHPQSSGAMGERSHPQQDQTKMGLRKSMWLSPAKNTRPQSSTITQAQLMVELQQQGGMGERSHPQQQQEVATPEVLTSNKDNSTATTMSSLPSTAAAVVTTIPTITPTMTMSIPTITPTMK